MPVPGLDERRLADSAWVIDAEDIGKTFGEGEMRRTVLEGVDVKIGQGEYVAVVGASGSGKSTLLGLLGCLDRPTSGVLHVCGRRVDAMSAADLARLRNRSLGFVFQAPNLLPKASALDNAALPLVYTGVSRSERRRRAAEMLGRLGLADRLGYLPAQLSGGQQQRVAIARALVTEPRVVFADEPTGALDSTASANIDGILRDIARRGVTVVMVTHDVALGASADRMIRVRDGKVERGEESLCA